MSEPLSDDQVLKAHQFSVHKQAQPIFDEKPWRMTPTIWGCTCGWVGSDEPMAADQVPGDVHRAHVAAILTARVADAAAAARATAVEDFLRFVESSGAYNGADDPGQRFYDWGLNPWLWQELTAFRAALAPPVDHAHAAGGTEVGA